MYDLAIIGGGVAGMTAAIYAARAGMNTVIIEQGGFGGQVALTAKIENYPSYKEVEGFQLAADMKAQVDSFGVESRMAQVKALSKDGDIFTVATDSGEIQARTVIIANGVRKQELGIKGEEEFRGRGVSWCAVCDGNFFRKKRTAVIGSGNSAIGDAVYLANLCEDVYVVFRRDKPTAAKHNLEQLDGVENVHLIPRSIPVEIKGDRKVTALTIKKLDTDEVSDIEVSGVFEAMGQMIPDNELFCGLVELDKRGYIVTDEEMRTSTPGLYAAGDTRQKNLRQIITACADGALAATSAHSYLRTVKQQ